MGSWYKEQLNNWVNELEVTASILFDIGGSQNPLKGRTKSWDVKDYKIVDLAEPHVTLQLPDLAQDFNHPLDEDMFREYLGKVDTIYCLGVFDYVINPNIAMQNLYDLMSPGGSAWVEFPFIYPHHNPIEVDGLRYTWPSINNLAKQSGLQVTDVWKRRPLPENHHLLDFFSVDRMRAAPNFDHNVTGYIVKLTK